MSSKLWYGTPIPSARFFADCNLSHECRSCTGSTTPELFDVVAGNNSSPVSPAVMISSLPSRYPAPPSLYHTVVEAARPLRLVSPLYIHPVPTSDPRAVEVTEAALPPLTTDRIQPLVRPSVSGTRQRPSPRHSSPVTKEIRLSELRPGDNGNLYETTAASHASRFFRVTPL